MVKDMAMYTTRYMISYLVEYMVRYAIGYMISYLARYKVIFLAISLFESYVVLNALLVNLSPPACAIRVESEPVLY